MFFSLYSTDEPSVRVENLGNEKYAIDYLMKEPGTYTNSIKFGGQCIPRGFYCIEVSTITVVSDSVERNWPSHLAMLGPGVRICVVIFPVNVIFINSKLRLWFYMETVGSGKFTH